MPQPPSNNLRQQWKENFLKQRESGLSIEQWCRENNVVPHIFHYWKRKLFPKKKIDRSAFTEINDQNKASSAVSSQTGVSIEYQGIRICLDQQFDLLTLKQCLQVVKEITC